VGEGHRWRAVSEAEGAIRIISAHLRHSRGSGNPVTFMNSLLTSELLATDVWFDKDMMHIRLFR
jgi:hypothetical protein